MLRLLTAAAKAVGLTYSILSTTVLIGVLIHGTYKAVKKR